MSQLSEHACTQAAEVLLTRRQLNQAGEVLKSEYRPTNLEDALAIQNKTVQLSHQHVAGWKCLLPLNDQHMVVAPILKNTIQRGDNCLVQASVLSTQQTLIEPEIAFVLGADLPDREQPYSVKEIDAAVSTCHLALELLQVRYAENADLSFYDKLADCLVNQGIFVGPEITQQQAYLASEMTINMTQMSAQSLPETMSFAGKHPNQLPQQPLYWLINFMRERGVSFYQGETIITGSYAGAIMLNIGQTTIEYQGFGKYDVLFQSL